MTILRLTDGPTTINLTGGFITLAGYVPVEPELSAVEFEPTTVMDGGEVAAITRRNVTEQCQITIAADTQDEVQMQLRDLQTMIMRVIEYQNRKGGTRVYVEFSPDDTDVYRSELLYARLELGENPLSWLAGGPALSAAIIWKRRFYWEGAEQYLDLVNTHGAGKAGVLVYNHYDDANDNWVDVSGPDVEGVVPTPAKIEILNNYASGILGNVIIGHNVYADPGEIMPVLECELATTTIGSAIDDSDCSATAYMQVDLADSREVLMTWTISSADLSHFRGRFFRLWLRCQAAPTEGTYLLPKLILGVGSSQVAAEGQESLLDASGLLQDLGVLQIPPYLMGETGVLYQMDLALYGRRTGGGSLSADVLLLMPLDSYRELRPRGHGVDVDITLVDDGIEDVVYAEGYGAGGDERTGFYYALGPKVMLVPGNNQRVYFLMSNTAGGSEIDRLIYVRAAYRPRRLTI